MKKITVFTPAYNRAYTLHKCYESLKNQTCKDFIWIIVDDGSTDNTKELVEKWIAKENGFKINYYYQKNQGMHGAHNKAYELIDTELNVCIDSDDYMPDNAIELILKCWEKNRNKGIGGIVALDAFEDGRVIGDIFPEDIEMTYYYDIYHKLKLKGDKKLIYRSELTKKYPYPLFEDEKYVSLGYKYNKLNDRCKLVILNKVVCIVEYMEDGSSRNMLKQYLKNPKGFSFIRIENMKNINYNLKFKFKECIHYIATSIISKNFNFLKDTPFKIMSILAIPFGVVFYFYIKKNTREKSKGGNIWKYFISR